MDRVILHCDLNNFFASVETMLNPALRGIPMAVAGDPAKRAGIILAKNELAKATGVKTAETIWQAKRKCPNLTVIQPTVRYSEYSKKVFAVYERYTDLVEPFGIDEAWLDMTGALHEYNNDGEKFADFLRETIQKELGLTISVGVSFNKVFAKLGSDYDGHQYYGASPVSAPSEHSATSGGVLSPAVVAKMPLQASIFASSNKKPNTTTVISIDGWEKIVYPLPVESLLFVGKKAKETLAKLGIFTIGELAKYDVNVLEQHLGKLGRTIYEYANGRDNGKVAHKDHYEPPKSVGNGRTFEKDIRTEQEVKKEIYSLSDEVGFRLRKAGLYANCINVAVKWPNLKWISKQHVIENSTNSTLEIAEFAYKMIHEIWVAPAPIRNITITATNLSDERTKSLQQSLFYDIEKHIKKEKIDEAMDIARKKYGLKTLVFGGEE